MIKYHHMKLSHTLSRISRIRDGGRPLRTLTAAEPFLRLQPSILKRRSTSEVLMSTSTLEEQKTSLLSFPPNVQKTIKSFQELFNRDVKQSDGLFELYDEFTTKKMWDETMKRNDMTMNPSDATITNTQSEMLSKQAGVLVLFVYENDDLSIVFTRRSRHLSSHASQISFPGGHYEEGEDDSIVDTAIREAVEELHAPTGDDVQQQQQQFRQNLHIFGCTTPIPSLRGMPVTPVLAVYSNPKNASANKSVAQLWPGNPSEVELVFTVPVSTLILEHQQHSVTSVDAATFDRTNPKSKSFSPQYPTTHGTIWGLTAYILQPLIKKLLIPVVAIKSEE